MKREGGRGGVGWRGSGIRDGGGGEKERWWVWRGEIRGKIDRAIGVECGGGSWGVE